MTEPRSSVCHWTEDDSGIWYTQCGEAFEFIVDGPSENAAKYCLYCGGILVEVAYIQEIDVEEDDE